MGAKAAVLVVIVLAVAGFTAYPMINEYLTQEDEIQVTVGIDGSGIQSVLQSGKYEKGSEVTVTAEVMEGYTFLGWYNADGNCVATDNPYKFRAEQNVTLNARAAMHPVNLTVNLENGVSVSHLDRYEKGSEVELTAILNDHFDLDGWYMGGIKVCSETTYTLKLNGDTVLDVRTIEDPKATVHISGEPAEAFVSITETFSGYVGDVVTVSAEFKDGYRFLGWEGFGTKVTDTSYTFTLAENLTVKATAEKIPVYTVTLTNADGGCDKVTGAGTYREGSMVRIDADVSAGRMFMGWFDGTSSKSDIAQYSFPATSDITLDARTDEDLGYMPDHKVTVMSDGPGIAGMSGTGTYSQGDKATLSVAMNDGYRFDGWYIDGNLLSASTLHGMTVTGDVTVIAKTSVQDGVKYDTSLSHGFKGDGVQKVIVGDDSPIYYGTVTDITAVLEPGYALLGWYDTDDNLVSKTNPMKIAFHGISVYARAVPQSVISAYSDSGVVAVSGTGNFGPYSTTVLSVELEEGRKFDGWYLLDGTNISSDPQLRVSTDASKVYIAKTDAPSVSGGASVSLIGNPYDVHDCTTLITDSNGHLVTFFNSKSQKTLEGLPEGTYDITYYGKADDGHYHMITDSVSTDGSSVKHYSWISGGKQYTLDWDVTLSDYQSYKSKTDRHPYKGAYSDMVAYAAHDSRMDPIVDRLLYLSQGMTQQQRADFVLDFTQQSVEYELDHEHLGITDDTKEYWKFPYETLFDRAGDCEDGTLLYCYLMKELNYQTALVMVPNHMMASVHLDGEVTGTSFEHDAIKYYLVETTNNGSNVGDNPGEYKTLDEIIPVPMATA